MNFAKPSVLSDALKTVATSGLSLPSALETSTPSALTPLGSWNGASEASAIAFIDGSVADYQTLVAGIAPGTEVHILNSSQDAVTQITNTLLGRHNISSLHIVSHGEAGGLDFGAGKLNLSTLPTFASQIQSWQQALTDDADILLYGCDVAQGELGKAFTSILSQLTGADVAASNNLTGNDALGGDWKLEVQTGRIETFSVLSPLATQAYGSVLGGSDSFSSRTVLTGGFVSDTGSNVVATAETSEPDHAGLSNPVKSVWWTWTAPTSGTYEINTVGSNFDTTLGVYTGSNVSTLSLIGSNDDSPYGLPSQVIFSATAGTAYQIAVAGYSGSTGSISLNISGTTVGVTAGVTPVENSLTNGTFNLNISNPSPNPLTVNYGLGGNATSGSDYTLVAGTNVTSVSGSSFVLAGGATSATLIASVINDSLAEPDETIQLTLTGGLGYTLATSNSSTLTIAANDNNAAPVVTLSGAAVSFAENGSATTIDTTASVTDTDSVDFNSGTLTASFSANGTVDDRLAINNEGTGVGQIGVSGGNVTYGGTTIGTFTGGVGTTPLVVTFNSSSSPAAAQALLRNFTYGNVSDAPSTSDRTLSLVLTDGDGGTSTTANKTIKVAAINDAPTVTAPSAITVTEDTATTLTGISFADIDAGSGTMSAVLNVGAGSLSATAGNGVTVAGSASSSITLNGTLTALNSFLTNSLTYTPALNDVTPQTLG
ncbi:MAG: DUF4347 domain-containing protein [Lyngbya sp. HA4199-MV5]|jgi:hypothetical protein|nr:DUF4347 domain-containing protein [Lyngbya sp. HA4199-MV5]